MAAGRVTWKTGGGRWDTYRLCDAGRSPHRAGGCPTQSLCSCRRLRSCVCCRGVREQPGGRKDAGECYSKPREVTVARSWHVRSTRAQAQSTTALHLCQVPLCLLCILIDAVHVVIHAAQLLCMSKGKSISKGDSIRSMLT